MPVTTNRTHAYSLTAKAKSLGHDLQHAQFITGADLLIHDAQYTAEEYPAKIGWGHSTVEYAVKLSNKAQVKRLALTHHDPSRDDDALDRLVASTKAKLRKNASSLEVFAAREGHALEPRTRSRVNISACCVEGDFEAQTLVDPALTEPSVIIGIADVKTGAALFEAIQAEGIHAKFCSDPTRRENSLPKIARRSQYLSTIRRVSTAWKHAARFASRTTIPSIHCRCSSLLQSKTKRVASRRASPTG